MRVAQVVDMILHKEKRRAGLIAHAFLWGTPLTSFNLEPSICSPGPGCL